MNEFGQEIWGQLTRTLWLALHLQTFAPSPPMLQLRACVRQMDEPDTIARRSGDPSAKTRLA